MIDLQEFEPVLVKAIQQDPEAMETVNLVLQPYPFDDVAVIQQKLRIYYKLHFGKSMTFEDAPFHEEIDKAFAEQIVSLLQTGTPRYKVIMIIGYRESAKTARVKMAQSYMTVYMPEFLDFINVVSEDGSSSAQFCMDLFNIFALSKVSMYFPGLIEGISQAAKKVSQTMSRFTTTTGVTYAASGARKSKRGAQQINVDEEGEIEMKRPKESILDDIENEVTVRSFTITQAIRSVIQSTINGMDQKKGFAVVLGNYLSLRGNVHYFLDKYRDNPAARVIMIPIHDGREEPTWPAKYCKTNAEAKELAEQGVFKVSIEGIKANTDNFDTEYLNNPSRSLVYFSDEIVATIDEDSLVDDDGRDAEGFLEIEPPQKHSRYVISADTAKGNGGHFSAFTILKVNGAALIEVGNFKSNTITPENFATYTENMAERYNHAFIVPEINYPGNEFIAFIKGSYNHIYIDENENYGVHTNLRTKPDMFVRTKKMLKEKTLIIQSRAMYQQILEYPSDDVETVKSDGMGGHFDLLMALVIGVYKANLDSEQLADDPEIDATIERMFNEENLDTR